MRQTFVREKALHTVFFFCLWLLVLYSVIFFLFSHLYLLFSCCTGYLIKPSLPRRENPGRVFIVLRRNLHTHEGGYFRKLEVTNAVDMPYTTIAIELKKIYPPVFSIQRIEIGVKREDTTNTSMSKRN